MISYIDCKKCENYEEPENNCDECVHNPEYSDWYEVVK